MNLETFLRNIRVELDDGTDDYKDSIFTSKNSRLDSDILNIFEQAEFSEEYIDDEYSWTNGVLELIELPILENISNDRYIKNQSITNDFQVLTNLSLNADKSKVEELKASIKLLKLRNEAFNKIERQLDAQVKLFKSAKSNDIVQFEQIYLDFFKARISFDLAHEIQIYFPDIAASEIENFKQQNKELEKAKSKQTLNFNKHIDTASRSKSLDVLNIDKYFDDFIGLDSIKAEIKKLVAFLAVQEARSKQGFKLKNPPTKHIVFTGSPGTGKTEMARLVAKIFYEVGIVENDIFVEADRSDLIGEYLGQTAPKTKAIMESALGGVLFIDEAYSLKTRQDDMYGDEAIATLLKVMEDNRENLTVIVAGYEEEMDEFLETNPGLRSRFNRYIHFPDYSPVELFEILLKMCEGNHYQVENVELLSKIVPKHFEIVMEESGKGFANARFVRNYFESLIERQSLRVVIEANQDINLLRVTDFDLS